MGAAGLCHKGEITEGDDQSNIIDVSELRSPLIRTPTKKRTVRRDSRELPMQISHNPTVRVRNLINRSLQFNFKDKEDQSRHTKVKSVPHANVELELSSPRLYIPQHLAADQSRVEKISTPRYLPQIAAQLSLQNGRQRVLSRLNRSQKTNNSLTLYQNDFMPPLEPNYPRSVKNKGPGPDFRARRNSRTKEPGKDPKRDVVQEVPVSNHPPKKIKIIDVNTALVHRKVFMSIEEKTPDYKQLTPEMKSYFHLMKNIYPKSTKENDLKKNKVHLIIDRSVEANLDPTKEKFIREDPLLNLTKEQVQPMDFILNRNQAKEKVFKSQSVGKLPRPSYPYTPQEPSSGLTSDKSNANTTHIKLASYIDDYKKTQNFVERMARKLHTNIHFPMINSEQGIRDPKTKEALNALKGKLLNAFAIDINQAF